MGMICIIGENAKYVVSCFLHSNIPIVNSCIICISIIIVYFCWPSNYIWSTDFRREQDNILYSIYLRLLNFKVHIEPKSYWFFFYLMID